MPSHLFTYPIIGLQALWVLVRTPRLPPAQGHGGRIGSGSNVLRLTGLGDSIIAGTGVERQEQALTGQLARLLHQQTGRAVRWQVLGENGATSQSLLEQIPRSVAPSEIYLLSVGVNDSIRGTAPARFAENLHALLDTLHEKSPAALILLSGIPPLESFPSLPRPLGSLLGKRASRLRSAMGNVARPDPRRLYFDFPGIVAGDGFSRDGFHPGESACAQWAEWLLDLLLSAEPSLPSADRAGPSPPA
jgi:lysophospholipase L1-like esterase